MYVTRSPSAPADDPSAAAPVAPSGPSPALVAAELARIERSSTFHRSPLHRRLLRYLVTRTLAGDAARLKESVIAVEVEPCCSTAAISPFFQRIKECARAFS